MCECICGELNLIAAYPIAGTDAILGVDEYRGCEGCGTPLGFYLRLFTPAGWNEWGEEGWSGIKPSGVMVPDDFGGNDGFGWRFPLIGQEDLIRAVQEDEELKDVDLSRYATLEDFLSQWGLRLLQAAMECRKKEQ